METVNLTVSKQTITSDRSFFVSNTFNVYQCHFIFDEEWDGYVKTASFLVSGANDPYNVLLDENNNCDIPGSAIAHSGFLEIGVYGVKGSEDDANFQQYPTIYTPKLRVLRGAKEGQEPEPPSPDIYEQILLALGRIENTVNDLKQEIGELEPGYDFLVVKKGD